VAAVPFVAFAEAPRPLLLALERLEAELLRDALLAVRPRVARAFERSLPAAPPEPESPERALDELPDRFAACRACPAEPLPLFFAPDAAVAPRPVPLLVSVAVAIATSRARVGQNV